MPSVTVTTRVAGLPEKDSRATPLGCILPYTSITLGYSGLPTAASLAWAICAESLASSSPSPELGALFLQPYIMFSTLDVDIRPGSGLGMFEIGTLQGRIFL